jgi:four helix bundle protein
MSTFNFEKLAIRCAARPFQSHPIWPEGSSRASRVDFARFVEIATGSLFEVVSQAKLSLNQHFLSEADYTQIAARAEKQCRMLSGPRKSLG